MPNFLNAMRIIPGKDPGTVMYLQIRDDLFREHLRVMNTRQVTAIFDLAREIAGLHMVGEDDRIEPALRSVAANLADDIASDREPVLRTGDFILLAEHARAEAP